MRKRWWTDRSTSVHTVVAIPPLSVWEFGKILRLRSSFDQNLMSSKDFNYTVRQHVSSLGSRLTKDLFFTTNLMKDQWAAQIVGDFLLRLPTYWFFLLAHHVCLQPIGYSIGGLFWSFFLSSVCPLRFYWGQTVQDRHTMCVEIESECGGKTFRLVPLSTPRSTVTPQTGGWIRGRGEGPNLTLEFRSNGSRWSNNLNWWAL